MSRERRDTVPAPPVPSVNPTAVLRDELEARLAEAAVAIWRDDSGLWQGLLIEDGVAKTYTIEMWEGEARAWLKRAKAAVATGAWIPTVCPRCGHVRLTPSTCAHC